MKLSYVAFVASILVAAPLLAQAQSRPGAPGPGPQQPPRGQPPAATAPVADAPAPQPPSPAQLESQRRRDEQSVDLDQLLARVSQKTGKKFLVDPRVRLRVYGVPKIEDPTYAELLAILRLHGYAAAEIAGIVNIVPDANARFMPVRLLNRDDSSVPDDEFVTRVIETQNAHLLVPVLRPLMPQSAHLAAVLDDEETGSSKLILMDTYANVRRMTELVNALRR
jgi:general secretion pathway protein D